MMLVYCVNCGLVLCLSDVAYGLHPWCPVCKLSESLTPVLKEALP